VITVAGIILALSFAAIALIPIQGFARSPSPFASGCCSTRYSRAPCGSGPSCNFGRGKRVTKLAQSAERSA